MSDGGRNMGLLWLAVLALAAGFCIGMLTERERHQCRVCAEDFRR